MAEFGGDLDRWLEAPYLDAARFGTDFEKWCDANDEDAEDDFAWVRFEHFLAAQQADIPEPPEDWDVDPRDLAPHERGGAPVKPGETRRLLH